MATSPCLEKSEMFKKSLIASVLAIATFGAFAQAPATTASPAAPASVTMPAAPADTAKAKREELRKKVMEERKAKLEAEKAKHEEMKVENEAEKAKRDEAKPVHAKEKAEKSAKKIVPEVPAKQ
jgi:hypothetical protein